MTARWRSSCAIVPDDFVFTGTKTSAYRQIANAVPPLLGEAIGRLLTKTVSTVQKRAKAA